MKVLGMGGIGLVMVLLFGWAKEVFFPEGMDFALFGIGGLLRVSLALIDDKDLFGRSDFDSVMFILIEAKRAVSLRSGGWEIAQRVGEKVEIC